MSKPSEPMAVAFARTRLEWFKMWKQIGIMLANGAQKKLMVEAEIIRDWEREVEEWGT